MGSNYFLLEILRETCLHVLSRQREFRRDQSLRIVNEYTLVNDEHATEWRSNLRYVNQVLKIVGIF